jgi:hypothetical protein
VVHAFAHRFVLRGHQAGRLCAGQPECVFDARSVEVEDLGRGRGRSVGAEYRSGVPPARQHLRAVQCQAHARTDLEACDDAEKELRAAHLAFGFSAGQKRWQHQ